MGGRHADDAGGCFHGLAAHRFGAADDAECARGGDAERVQCLPAEILANGGAKHRAAVEATGEGCGATALEVQIPAFPAAIDHLAQENRTAVAQLRDEDAELVTGIEHGDGIAAGNRLCARHTAEEFRAHGLGRIKVDEGGRFGVEVHQHRLGQRGGCYPDPERLAETGVAVIEGEPREGPE
jgi:hypothetical protein